MHADAWVRYDLQSMHHERDWSVGRLIVPLFLTLGLILLLLVLWRIEPRSMLNAGIFGVALVFGYLMLVIAAFNAESDRAVRIYGILVLFLVIGLPLLYIVGSIALILNGRTMARREGVSLAHMLGPVVGLFPVLVIVALIGGVFLSFLGATSTPVIIVTFVTIACAIFGYFLWNAFCAVSYGWLYTVMPKEQDPDFIIVHGAGLIHGKVGPLLASRLDRAMVVFEGGGGRAIMIPSGGQGDDEPRSEAFAMAEYLIDHGIPAEKVVPEDQSRTTDENMRFSKMIIDKLASGRVTVVFVTSNYHVFRTALIARRVGLKAQGVGSKTARYYLPSAIIREFIAIIVMYKWWHIVPMGLMAALLALMFALT